MPNIVAARWTRSGIVLASTPCTAIESANFFRMLLVSTIAMGGAAQVSSSRGAKAVAKYSMEPPRHASKSLDLLPLVGSSAGQPWIGSSAASMLRRRLAWRWINGNLRGNPSKVVGRSRGILGRDRQRADLGAAVGSGAGPV